MKEFLGTLLNSLGSIEVRGRDNLDTLLGCMLAVERMIAELEAAEAAAADPKDETEEDDNG